MPRALVKRASNPAVLISIWSSVVWVRSDPRPALQAILGDADVGSEVTLRAGAGSTGACNDLVPEIPGDVTVSMSAPSAFLANRDSARLWESMVVVRHLDDGHTEVGGGHIVAQKVAVRARVERIPSDDVAAVEAQVDRVIRFLQTETSTARDRFRTAFGLPFSHRRQEDRKSLSVRTKNSSLGIRPEQSAPLKVEAETQSPSAGDNRQTRIWGLAGIAVTILLTLLAIWWSDGSSTLIEGDCNAVGQATVECNSTASPERRAWERLPDFAGPPKDWELVEEGAEVLDAVFGESEVLDGGADEFVQESEYRRLAPGEFSTLAVDVRTATVGPPKWSGPWEAPFYAAVTVSIDAGPLDSSACGIAFDWRLDGNRVASGWKIVKLSGTTAAVTQHQPSVDGNVKHRALFEWPDAADSTEEIRIEILVLDDGWVAAVNGTEVGSIEGPIPPAFVIPALQQEDQRLAGRVQCSFKDWELWAPANPE